MQPASIGRYRILHTLQKRDGIVVFAAQDSALNRPLQLLAVAKAELEADTYASYLSGFARHADTVRRVAHRRFLPVHGCGEVDGWAYLATALVGGTDLAARLEQPPLPVAEAIAITIALAEPLSALHRAKLVHRWLKANHVLLPEDGGVLLTGFDFALDLAGRNAKEEVKTLVGSLASMAPEQILGDAVGPRTDIYALGVLLYRMLTGKHPFDAPGAWQIAKRTIQEEAPAPSSLRSGLSPSLDAVVLRALARKAAERYASMDELAAALRDAQASPADAAPPPARYVGYAELEMKDDSPDEAYEQASDLVDALREIMAANRVVVHKTIGTLLLFTSESGVDTLHALAQCHRFATSRRQSAAHGWQLRSVLHHGPVILRDGDVFGDHLSIVSSLHAHCRGGGIFLSTPAFVALPTERAKDLRVSSQTLAKRPKLASLTGSEQIYELPIPPS